MHSLHLDSSKAVKGVGERMGIDMIEQSCWPEKQADACWLMLDGPVLSSF